MPKAKTHIWKHFMLYTKGSHQKESVAACNFCSSEFKVNATRMKKHLVRDCRQCPKAIKAKYEEQVAVSCFKLKSDCTVSYRKPFVAVSAAETCSVITGSVESEDYEVDTLPATCTSLAGSADAKVSNSFCGSHSQATSASTSDLKVQSFVKKEKVTLFTFADKMSVKEQTETDIAFAKAVYATASPLSMCDNQHWQEFFRKLRPAWKPPSRHAMSNGLLTDWVQKVQMTNQKKVDEAPALAILSDGWSCVSGDSHIQFLLSTPDPIFIKSIHPKATSHTANFICDEVSKIMDGDEGTAPILGRAATDVWGFCTDNASNMKSAWELLRTKYPWLFCYGCAAHSLNLLAGDFRKIDAIMNTLDDNRSISKLFRDHQIPNSVLEEKSTTNNGKPLTCILGVPTRWSTDYCMLKRNIRLKESLMHCTFDARCSKAFAVKKSEKALILDDDGFWTKSRLVADLLEPIRDAIAEVEGDATAISVMPRLWNVLRSRVKKAAHKLFEKDFVSKDDMEQVFNFVDSREEFSMQPVHMAASILDPRFQGRDLSDERVAMAETVILQVASKIGIADSDCLDDLAEFRTRQGYVYSSESRAHMWTHASSLDLMPLSWWKSYAPSRPLGRIGKILLALPSSIAAVERANKAYSLQKTKNRNRLTDERSANLTMVAYNLQSNYRKMETTNSHKKMQTALLMPRDTDLPALSCCSDMEVADDESNPVADSGDETECDSNPAADDAIDGIPTEYAEGDYVVVSFNGKKKSVIHYIGLIGEQKSHDCDDDDSVANSAIGLQRPDWKVKFLRRESPSAFTFVFPNVDEVSIVNENSFCDKLPFPTGSGTARKRSHLMFPIDLSHYNLR